jgi:hypothetical protein
MRGSGYSIEPACSADAAPGALCPTLSHLTAVGGPAQMRADWAFVSPVSAVSANLKTNRDGIEGWRRQRRALVGAFSPSLRQVGQVQMSQVFVVRQQGWDAGGTAGDTHWRAHPTAATGLTNSPPTSAISLQARSFASVRSNS